MKKTQKGSDKPAFAPKTSKGQKLSYDNLRIVVMDTIQKSKIQPWSARQLLKKIKVANGKSDGARVLEGLVKQGKLSAGDEGTFTSLMDPKISGKEIITSKPVSQNTSEGVVDMTRSGSAYVIVDGMEEDIYVPSKYLGGAMNRDRVEVEIISNRRGKKPEGKIVNIRKRAIEHIIGTLKIYKKFSVVVPDKATIQFDILVPADKLFQAVDGDKVVVKITDWTTTSPAGEIVHVLGASGSHELEMQSILVHAGFNLAWPEPVLDECKHLPEEITEEEISRRRDFRKITTFTIDPATAKDFDDAISIQTLENGNTEVGVHIADVSHYVRPGTALDKEAYLRSTSVYLVDRVCPMLPEKLSNELCSLRPQEESLCYAAVFEIDSDFKILSRWFGRTVIFSDHRFSYEEAQEVLDRGEGPFEAELKKLNKIAKGLRKKRFRDGAITFETDELQFKVDELGETLEIFVKERKDTHLLIEDFMLLANREVATLIAQKSKTREIPFPYRVHDVPDPDRLIDFQRFARELGVQLQIDTPKQISKSFNKLAELAKEDEKLRLLEPLAIRTMAKAIYTTDNIGHYGLAFDYYTHFTSPIRRYSDVLVHRILDGNLNGIMREDKSTLEAKCKHISERERAAMNAERESIKYKQMEFLKNQVGKEFDGVISGVIESGIFVMLDDSRAEGMVPFRSMHGGFYQTAPYKAGSRSGDEFTIGQPVKARIRKIDLAARQMDLEMVGFESGDTPAPTRRSVPPERGSKSSKSTKTYGGRKKK
ncbi:MAG: ribonuclease R [Bacteroidota bacterium]|nr:ribonuclease R [Bacteroidota bacterium]